MTSFVTPAPPSILRRGPLRLPARRPASARFQRRLRPRFPTLALDTARTDAQAQIDHASTDALVDTVRQSALPLPDSLIRDMVRHLADSRGLARLSLVDQFGRVGSQALPTLLHALAHHPNPVVRRSCGKALAKVADPAATQPLLHTLVNDDDTVTRASAAGALAKMGITAVPALLALISDPAVGMTAKGHAAWAISFMQGDAADALFQQLNNSNDDVRIAVVSALGGVAIGDALPAMGAQATNDWLAEEALIDDQSGVVQQRAIDALRAAMGDQSPQVLAEVVTALANVGCVDEAPAIANMLDHPDPELRRCAALSLMKLGDPSYIAVLTKKSEDDAQPQDFRSVAKLAAITLQRKLEDDEDDWD